MNNISTPTFIIPSYNPYIIKYPDATVVSREALHLIKMLRANGNNVIVTPEIGSKLCYIAEKGLRETLNNPLFIEFAGEITGALLIGLGALLAKWSKTLKEKNIKSINSSVIYSTMNNDQIHYFDADGNTITAKQYEAVKSTLLKRQLDFAKAISQQPPDIFYPNPIFVEHTNQIVGWASDLEEREDGIYIPSAKIHNKKILRGVKKGIYKGFSIGGIVTRSTCGVCNKQYSDCNHIAGQDYDNLTCSVHIDTFGPAEISLVKNPAHPLNSIKFTH